MVLKAARFRSFKGLRNAKPGEEMGTVPINAFPHAPCPGLLGLFWHPFVKGQHIRYPISKRKRKGRCSVIDNN